MHPNDEQKFWMGASRKTAKLGADLQGQNRIADFAEFKDLRLLACKAPPSSQGDLQFVSFSRLQPSSQLQNYEYYRLSDFTDLQVPEGHRQKK